MKRSIVSAILIVALLIAALPLAAVATDISAKTIAQEYKQLINSATLLKYAESIAFFDLDGNTIPELFLMTESTPALAEIQIWTYKNGGTKKIGTITWGLASAGYTLYVNASGNLVSSGGPSSVDFGFWHYIDTYSFDTGGNLFAIEKVALTEQIYDIKSGTRVKLEQPLVTGTVNGQQVTEKEANRILETKNNEYRTAKVKNVFDNGFSKKSDAIIFLDGIDAFFDVPGGEYYSEPVKWAVENGITNGTGDYSFSPGSTCTRAQILTFLWRASGSPTVEIANPYYDVNTGDYYYQAALWAYQNGMVSGTAFEGTTPCTRAATVTYIWQSKGNPSSDAASFTDVPAGSTYSQAVAWAVNNRITDGVGNNQFAPDMICSRGQIVTFLYRARNISGAATEKPADDSVLGIESAYIPLLNEIRSAILTGNDHGLSENAQAYISCKQLDYGQGGSIDSTLFALVDLDGNGTKELLLSGAEHNLDALYTIQNGAVLLIRYYAFGQSRYSASVYGNYILENYMISLNSFVASVEMLTYGSTNLSSMETIDIEYSSNGSRTYNSNIRGAISESEYYGILTDYQSQPEPTWLSLSEYSF